MLWIRGLLFTLFVPFVVGVVVPAWIDEGRSLRGGPWNAGWLIAAAGAVVYSLCLLRFLASGGTPAVFFTRPLRFVIGEEPPRLVDRGLYRVSRNPMYLGVLLVAAGQAVVFASAPLAGYAAALAVMFHLVVVLIEEPHLRRARGPSYEEYCRQVPRWLGWPTRSPLRPMRRERTG
jgi:protein-S-isoprenylcysteine O-methyltransferase Ste14